MLSYNPACEPLEPVKTQKNGNTAKFMVATYDLPRNINHGTFTPLVFTTSGGTGPAAFLFFKHLASMLAAKHQKPYAHVLGWIRCCLSFSLLRSSIVCLRGARSAYHRPIAEGHVST